MKQGKLALKQSILYSEAMHIDPEATHIDPEATHIDPEATHLEHQKKGKLLQAPRDVA